MITHQDYIRVAIEQAEAALQTCCGKETTEPLRAAIAALRQANNVGRRIDLHARLSVYAEDGRVLMGVVDSLNERIDCTFFRVKGLTAWFRSDEVGKTWFWND